MADGGTDWGSAGAFLGAGAMSALGAYFANKQQQKLLNKQWSQSIELSNTAHQREVADLLKAGLNPILSANGTGASVPSLGTGSFENVGQGLSDGLSSASKLMSDEYKANVASVKANTKHVNEITSALKADRKVENINREADELLAETRLEAVKKLTGHKSEFGKDGAYHVTFDRDQNQKWVDLIAGGIQAEADIKDNANWRSNLSSFLPFISPAGLNSAASAYDTIKYPKRRYYR